MQFVLDDQVWGIETPPVVQSPPYNGRKRPIDSQLQKQRIGLDG